MTGLAGAGRDQHLAVAFGRGRRRRNQAMIRQVVLSLFPAFRAKHPFDDLGVILIADDGLLIVVGSPMHAVKYELTQRCDLFGIERATL